MGGGGGARPKKKKKMACLFLGGLDFLFFCFFGLAPCPTPSFYYQNNLFTALFISEPSGIREGGGQGQKKKKKIGMPLFRGAGFFFFFWPGPLPHPFILLPEQFIYSFVHFSELK